MFHNLQLGPDAQANATLARLRGLKRAGPIRSDSPVLPGLWFSFDPEAEADGDLVSEKGMLLGARLRARRPARWLALHLSLGGAALDPGGVAGFALRGEAAGPVALRACIRSGRAEGGFTEHFFAKEVLLLEEPCLHLDVQPLGLLPAAAPWRDFILFVAEGRSCSFTLRDLRLFIV